MPIRASESPDRIDTASTVSRWPGSARESALRGASLALAAIIAACGGGSGSTGNTADSGLNKTYLSVQASDADGDALKYEWRTTAGKIDNRNAKDTVWTMPDGPGLHFAYVKVSDGKGGYAEQQYAVSSDALATTLPARLPVEYKAVAASGAASATVRLRFKGKSAGYPFANPATPGSSAARVVYVPDMQVRVASAGGDLLFSGASDSLGDVPLPPGKTGVSYRVSCTTPQGTAVDPCTGDLLDVSTASLIEIDIDALLTSNTGRNLRLYGHIGFADGGVCGVDSEYFNAKSAATVQLLQSDGTVLTPPARVNRFGDYLLDAAVPVKGALSLKVGCEGYSNTVPVPASPNPAGYVSDTPMELSVRIPNSRPTITKVVASGPDGNVRGKMIIETPGPSNALPGTNLFLSYKGGDTERSGCSYYRALGAVRDCDNQGNPIGAITLDDWKRAHQLAPFKGTNTNTEASALYINRMDLNLVRKMTATRINDQHVAFYVCNHPGPDGSSQAEIDGVIGVAVSDTNLVACVAMEWTASPGVNNGVPFTKFFSFGPDGTLLTSVNLDGRGQKFLPGACVACHGGTLYNGSFPDAVGASPNLGSHFLAFDPQNYLYSSDNRYTEAVQNDAIYFLNQYVLTTENGADTPNSRLIKGWYGTAGGRVLDKAYTPERWLTHPKPGAATFYREVVGPTCRVCHAAMGANARFDFDADPDKLIGVVNPSTGASQLNPVANAHFCGGTADVAKNTVMPNALVSRDRLAERLQAEPALSTLMKSLIGCDAPLPDPIYPKR